MIKFHYEYEGAEKVTVTEKNDHAGLVDVFEAFATFIVAVGYSEESLRKIAREYGEEV